MDGEYVCEFSSVRGEDGRVCLSILFSEGGRWESMFVNSLHSFSEGGKMEIIYVCKFSS